MNSYQRTRLALQKKHIVAAKAKERQREGAEVKQKSAEPSVNARDAIAKSAGVGPDTRHASRLEPALGGAHLADIPKLLTSV